MYKIIERIIKTGNFRVNDLSDKIDTLWASCKLTDDERTELSTMMSDYLNPATNAPTQDEKYDRLLAEIETLKAEIKELKGETEETDPEVIVIPKWEPWDGVSDNYQFGAVVDHNNKYFLNVLEGMQNTWEPETSGVDDRYWKEITEEEAERIISEGKSMGE